MAKKTARKTRSPYKKASKKTTGYHVKVLLFSITSGFVVFMVGNLFIKPSFPCANTKSCQTDLKEQIDNNATGTFMGHSVVPPQINPELQLSGNSVLGASTATGTKHIYVDLSAQKLYAYQGDTQIMETYISSGKWNPTPVGNFHIWEKLVSTRMAGGEGADAYDLPNVPYVMYFYQDYGLHGAYWHNNFGHMMSHGCVNMRIVDAQSLYEWADGPTQDQQGTAVSVCNSFTAPANCVQNNPIND